MFRYLIVVMPATIFEELHQGAYEIQLFSEMNYKRLVPGLGLGLVSATVRVRVGVRNLMRDYKRK